MKELEEGEKNMGWDCSCTNYHTCDYHRRVSTYQGIKDHGTLPIEFEKFKEKLTV